MWNRCSGPLVGRLDSVGAIGIFSFEMWVKDQQFNQLLDMVDSLCDSEVQSYNANALTGSGEQSRHTKAARHRGNRRDSNGHSPRHRGTD